MFFLPASLLSLALLQVSAIPIDKYTCDPSRLSLILNPNWATSTAIHSYCSALFSPSYNSVSKPELPALEISSNATPTDVRKACECIVAMPLEPITSSPSSEQQSQSEQDSTQRQQLRKQAAMQQVQAQQKQQLQLQRLRLLPATEEQELKVRGGVVAGQTWQPYGRGALPAPVGSELKGFGARDNLYVRGGVLDGTRDRGV